MSYNLGWIWNESKCCKMIVAAYLGIEIGYNCVVRLIVRAKNYTLYSKMH